LLPDNKQILVGNVLAHVPDVNDFVAGMKILLKPGIFTMEFPICCSSFSKTSLIQFIMSIFLFFIPIVGKFFAAHDDTI